MTEAVQQLLIKNGYENVVTQNQSSNDFVPDAVLADIGALNQALFTRYPKAKVLLMDTGVDEEKIIATLLSYKIHGVLSPHTEVHLFKKALKVVSEGQIWIDNHTVKAVLHGSG